MEDTPSRPPPAAAALSTSRTLRVDGSSPRSSLSFPRRAAVAAASTTPSSLAAPGRTLFECCDHVSNSRAVHVGLDLFHGVSSFDGWGNGGCVGGASSVTATHPELAYEGSGAAARRSRNAPATFATAPAGAPVTTAPIAKGNIMPPYAGRAVVWVLIQYA